MSKLLFCIIRLKSVTLPLKLLTCLRGTSALQWRHNGRDGTSTSYGTSSYLTHRGRDKLDPILQTIFSNAFSVGKCANFALTLNFVPEIWPNNIPAFFFQIMAWRQPGDKPLSEPMMVSLLIHICVNRPQWVKAVLPRSELHPYFLNRVSVTKGVKSIHR